MVVGRKQRLHPFLLRISQQSPCIQTRPFSVLILHIAATVNFLRCLSFHIIHPKTLCMITKSLTHLFTASQTAPLLRLMSYQQVYYPFIHPADWKSGIYHLKIHRRIVFSSLKLSVIPLQIELAPSLKPSLCCEA